MSPRARSVLKKLAIAALIVAVVATTGYLLFPGLPASVKVYDVVHLNQEWTPAERQRYYHTSEGSQLMPYKWLLALEQADNEKPFLDPDHLTRFRILPDVNPGQNPDRLPVGFAKDPRGPGPEETVGITCAGCHTAQINYKGLGLRIDGAPGQLDLTRFLEHLGLAITATRLESDKFDRFARRVLGAGYNRTTKSQLLQRVRQYIRGRLKTLLQELSTDEELGLTATTPGFGRIDALVQGGNTLFGKLSPKNLRALSSPVDIIPLWHSGSYGWVQSNASIRQPMARNIIQALAVGSSVVLPGDSKTIYTSSVRLRSIAELEAMAARLKAPAWPEWLFGDLDQDKVARGRALYQELCAGCHQPRLETPETDDGVPVVPGPYPPDPVSQAAGRRLYHLRIFDLDTIGTDPLSATSFATRTVDATALGLSAKEPGANVIYRVVSGVMSRYYTEHNIPPEEQAAWNGHRANYWRAPKAYPARPLAGIWATAPYLHNGSVPNLYELLLPVEERSATFYTGNPELDPVRVGYETGRFYGGFKLDTSKTGNSNAGHEFRDGIGKGVIGRLLTDDERWQIIEYLKALRFEEEVPPAAFPRSAPAPEALGLVGGGAARSFPAIQVNSSLCGSPGVQPSFAASSFKRLLTSSS
jgi:hypothetical protein